MTTISDLNSETIQFGSIILYSINDQYDVLANFTINRLMGVVTNQFYGYSVLIETIDDLTFSGMDTETITAALEDCQENLFENGFLLHVAGLDLQFSDAGFMRNSGFGYFNNNIVSVMYDKGPVLIFNT
jgi:hypothetical protein